MEVLANDDNIQLILNYFMWTGVFKDRQSEVKKSDFVLIKRPDFFTSSLMIRPLCKLKNIASVNLVRPEGFEP